MMHFVTTNGHLNNSKTLSVKNWTQNKEKKKNIHAMGWGTQMAYVNFNFIAA